MLTGGLQILQLVTSCFICKIMIQIYKTTKAVKNVDV